MTLSTRTTKTRNVFLSITSGKMAETDNLNVRVNALVNLASFSAAEKAVGSFTDNVMGMAKMIGGVIAAWAWRR